MEIATNGLQLLGDSEAKSVTKIPHCPSSNQLRRIYSSRKMLLDKTLERNSEDTKSSSLLKWFYPRFSRFMESQIDLG